MKGKKAIFCSTLSFSSTLRVGSHILAEQLAKKGWEILFIAKPVSPFHVFSGNKEDLTARFKKAFARTPPRHEAGRIREIIPFTLIPPHSAPGLNSDSVARHWWRFTFPSLRSIIEREGFSTVDLLYFDNAVMNNLLDCVTYRRAVYRMADNLDGQLNVTDAERRQEKVLCSRVDDVLCTSHFLLDVAKRKGARQTRYFPNGVELDKFLATGEEQTLPFLADIERPRAVYLGEMKDRFDFDMMAEVMAQRPHIQFVFAGHPEPARSRFQHLSNAHVIGFVPYAAVPALLAQCDVGLIPFQVKRRAELINGVNPLKLYQYMAVGLPVVANEWEELRRLQSPARLVNNSTEFTEALDAALAENGARRQQYIDYASQFGWEKRIADLEALLTEQEVSA